MKILRYKIDFFNFSNFNGPFFFKLGILFLPSAFPIGAFFLMIALLLSIVSNRHYFLKDKLNYVFIVISLLLIFSCIYNSIQISNGDYYRLNNIPLSVDLNIYSIYFDLLNWIPLFLTFWGFQYYLNSPEKRRSFAKYLIIGTFPVIFSCFAQYFLDWNEPLSGLNGLIVWFQRPNENKAISGLFSNPNYAGFWLAVSWPLSQYLFIEKSIFNFKKGTALFLSISILFFAIMTYSRNALLGILASSFLILRKKEIYKFTFIAFIGLFIFLLANSLITKVSINELILNIPENNILFKFTRFDFQNYQNYPRIELLNISLSSISERLLTGWGSGTFSEIYLLKGGQYNLTHTHNFLIELSYNFGIPAAMIIISLISFLFLNLFRKRFKANSQILINKAWLASSVIAIFYQITDMPYYDGKISILFWTLIAGLKCIGGESKNSFSK